MTAHYNSQKTANNQTKAPSVNRRGQPNYDWSVKQKHVAQRDGYGRVACSSEKAQRSKKTIKQTTEIVSRNLIIGSGGAINPYRQEANTVAKLDTSSGVVTYDDRLQNWLILPSVASAIRKDIEAALALFIHVSELKESVEVGDRDGELHIIPATHPGQQIKFRYMVLTGGSRIPLCQIETRIIFIRTLLKNAVRNLKNNGLPIHIVFQGVEVTLKRDKKRRVWAHPHLNILYRFERQLTKEEWQKFLEIMQKAFTDDEGNNLQWQECGILNNPAEVVKYVTKMTITDKERNELDCSVGEELAFEYEDEEHPTDYGEHIGLSDLTPEETVEYFYQIGPRDREGNVKRRKLMQPQGDFQTVNSAFNDWGIRFRNVVNEDGTFNVTPIAKERREKAPITPGGSPRIENQIMNESLCHPNAANERATTTLLVNNLTRHPKTEQGKRNLETIRQIFVERGEMAAANGYEYDAEEAFENFMSQKIPPKPNKFKQAIRAIKVHKEHDTKTTGRSQISWPNFGGFVDQAIQEEPSSKPHELAELIFIQGLTASPPPRIHEPHQSVFSH